MNLEMQNQESKFWRSIVSGQFLKSFFDWIRDVIQTADLSIVLLILVVLPLLVPAVPAWVTMKNLEEQMRFDHSIAVLGGITIELLGYAGALLSLKAITDWMKEKDLRNKKPLLWTAIINLLAYVFYLVAVVSINVILDNAAGKPTEYVLVIGLLCLLSVPSGMLSATRIISREEKAEIDEKEVQEKERIESERRYQDEKEAREKQQEYERELAILKLKEEQRTERVRISKSTSNNFNFEAGTSKPTSNSTSIPSGSTKKLKLNEQVKDFIEAVVKRENRFPSMPELRQKIGGSEGTVYYAMIEFLVEEADYLVTNGIVSQDKVEKAKISLAKKNKKAPTQP